MLALRTKLTMYLAKNSRLDFLACYPPNCIDSTQCLAMAASNESRCSAAFREFLAEGN